MLGSYWYFYSAFQKKKKKEENPLGFFFILTRVKRILSQYLECYEIQH